MIRMGLPRRVMVGIGLAPVLAFCPGFYADSPPNHIRQQSLKAHPGRDKSGPYIALAPTGRGGHPEG